MATNTPLEPILLEGFCVITHLKKIESRRSENDSSNNIPEHGRHLEDRTHPATGVGHKDDTQDILQTDTVDGVPTVMRLWSSMGMTQLMEYLL